MSEEAKDSQGKVASESSAATVWQCEPEFEVDGLPSLQTDKVDEKKLKEDPEVDLQQMTVGRKFLLRCQGEPVFFNKKKLQVFPEYTKPFALQLLEVRRLDEKSGDFVLTSYVPGKHKIPATVLTDGDEAVRLSEIALDVKSVVKAEKGKPPTPFGPFGPIELGWPLFVWIALAALIVSFVFSVIVLFFKRRTYKQRLEQLKEFDTALSAYEQFNKEHRGFKRRVEYNDSQKKMTDETLVDQIENNFKFYLVRELRVPAHEWDEKKTLKELKSRHRLIFKSCSRQIKMTFEEISKAQSHKDQLKWQDISLLLQLCQRTVSAIWLKKNKKPVRKKRRTA